MDTHLSMRYTNAVLKNETKKKILIPLPTRDFDPTEVAVPWNILNQAGFDVVFATPRGEPASADPIMVVGKELGPLRKLMIMDDVGRAAYDQMIASGLLNRPISYTEIKNEDYAGLFLPGGHAKGIREYLESNVLQNIVAQFMESDRPVAAICHGVVLAARSKSLSSGRSVLEGRKTTGLPKWMELLGWQSTRLWMGDYYRTYPTLVQTEVEEALGTRGEFIRGPIGLTRDSTKRLEAGFVVKDRNYLSGRWPGDAHRLSVEFVKLF